MGMYCACGERKVGKEEDYCKCDWTGWNRGSDPEANGKYLVRIVNNGGDCFEKIRYFSKTPLKKEMDYFGKEVFLHWEGTSWDDNCVYAWKSEKK